MRGTSHGDGVQGQSLLVQRTLVEMTLFVTLRPSPVNHLPAPRHASVPSSSFPTGTDRQVRTNLPASPAWGNRQVPLVTKDSVRWAGSPATVHYA